VFGLAYAFALPAGFLAIVPNPPMVRLVMGALAVTIVIAVTGAAMQFRHIQSRASWIDGSSASLWFRPLPSRAAWTMTSAVAALIPAATLGYGLTVGVPNGSPFLFLAVLALAIVGLASLGVIVWGFRVPAGLAIEPNGLRGIRACGDIHWSWDELGDVEVVAAPGAKLSLRRADGEPPVTAPMLYLGADPNDVAEIVRFFRDHPEERRVLAEGGERAIKRVVEVLASRAP